MWDLDHEIGPKTTVQCRNQKRTSILSRDTASCNSYHAILVAPGSRAVLREETPPAVIDHNCPILQHKAKLHLVHAQELLLVATDGLCSNHQGHIGALEAKIQVPLRMHLLGGEPPSQQRRCGCLLKLVKLLLQVAVRGRFQRARFWFLHHERGKLAAACCAVACHGPFYIQLRLKSMHMHAQ